MNAKSPFDQPGMSGVLNINKPRGMTSHDVVNRIRRLVNQKRVGHTGTLDPMASGVLIICVGTATRLVEFMANVDKSYRATIQLGVETDTWDADGQVLGTHSIDGIDIAQLRSSLDRFRGMIQQIPPMFSAIKRGGQPLYKLARQGITVERQPRQVEIKALRLLSWDPPHLVVEIDCSKGTYIRSLAHDLGALLGTGAHLAALTRLAVGRFRIEEALELPEVSEVTTSDHLQTALIPIEQSVDHLPRIDVDDQISALIGHGRSVSLEQATESELCCAFNRQGLLIAILRFDAEKRLWQPFKVLRPTESGTSEQIG